jgi:hypothetical protein
MRKTIAGCLFVILGAYLQFGTPQDVTCLEGSNGVYYGSTGAGHLCARSYENLNGPIAKDPKRWQPKRPAIANITNPRNHGYYNASTMPSTFEGEVADYEGGPGLDANSTTFYIRRVYSGSSGYWDGKDWTSSEPHWLATSHEATAGSKKAKWQSKAKLPPWPYDYNNVYYAKARATDKAGNIFVGSEISFYYDSTQPESIGPWTAPQAKS